jgi:hypothetical protein
MARSRHLRSFIHTVSALPSAIFPVAYAILGGSIIAVVQHNASLNVVNTYVGLQIALLVVLAVIIYLVRDIASRIEDLHKNSKLVVEYYESAQDAFSAGRRIVESAQVGASIRVVNSFVESDKSADGPAQKIWLDSLVGRLGAVHYHRIIQLATQDLERDGGRPLYEFIAPNYIEHYRQTLAVQRASHDRFMTRVDAVPARYPMTFAIIQNPGASPGGYLMVQISEYVQQLDASTALSMAGSFLIRDPDGQLVPHFVSFFTSLANSDKLRSVSMDELQAPPPALSPREETLRAPVG